MNVNRRVVAVCLALLVVCASASLARACPNCVDSLAANSSTGEPGTSGSMAGGLGGSMAAGYYYSILFMLAMLFSVTGAVFYMIRRQVKADAQLEIPDSSPLH